MNDDAGTTAGQLQLDAMPAPLFACTPNRLATFACPRRYRFTYLDRPPPPRGAPRARSTLGAVVHVALQRWWSLPRAHRTPDEGASLVERNWSDAGFRDRAQSLRACVAAAGWVHDYLTGVDPYDEPVGTERTVATRTRRLALSGRVDRIDRRGGELVVVDYKTGRRPPDDADAASSRALALYLLAARATLRESGRRVELHHLPTGRVAAFEHTEHSLAEHVAAAEATAAAIVGEREFPPRPGPSCGSCEFRRSCPEGRAASEESEPWSGLPDEVA